MIRYRLVCQKAANTPHEFEAWFKSSDDFDRQRHRNLVLCPECGSSKVVKALMAPSVRTARSRDKGERAPKPAQEGASERIETPAGPPVAASGPTAPPEPPMAPMASLTPEQRQFVEVMTKVREQVLKSSQNVGKRFAEEARKIHYQESDQRGIHGEATLAEAEALLEEGIDVYPLPILPGDRN